MFTWTDWPARRIPARAGVAGCLIGLTIFALLSVGLLYGVLGALVLFVTTAEILLPSRYALGQDGVSVLNPFKTVRRPWASFSHWEALESGFFLHARHSIRWLRGRRSVLLRCDTPDDSIRTILVSHLGAERAQTESDPP